MSKWITDNDPRDWQQKKTHNSRYKYLLLPIIALRFVPDSPYVYRWYAKQIGVKS